MSSILASTSAGFGPVSDAGIFPVLRTTGRSYEETIGALEAARRLLPADDTIRRIIRRGLKPTTGEVYRTYLYEGAGIDPQVRTTENVIRNGKHGGEHPTIEFATTAGLEFPDALLDQFGCHQYPIMIEPVDEDPERGMPLNVAGFRKVDGRWVLATIFAPPTRRWVLNTGFLFSIRQNPEQLLLA